MRDLTLHDIKGSPAHDIVALLFPKRDFSLVTNDAEKHRVSMRLARENFRRLPLMLGTRLADSVTDYVRSNNAAATSAARESWASNRRLVMTLCLKAVSSAHVRREDNSVRFGVTHVNALVLDPQSKRLFVLEPSASNPTPELAVAVARALLPTEDFVLITNYASRCTLTSSTPPVSIADQHCVILSAMLTVLVLSHDIDSDEALSLLLHTASAHREAWFRLFVLALQARLAS